MTTGPALPIESRPTYGWLMVLIGVVVAAGSIGGMWWVHYRSALETARAWTVTGPPCPSLSREAFAAQSLEARQAFNVGGVRWARASAMVICETVTEDGGFHARPVCQFSSPGVLRITTSRGDYYFAPGLGRRATVSVKDGVASCVIGSSVDFTN